jgi:RNA polymerase sigma-70 factor, ECF subfamily
VPPAFLPTKVHPSDTALLAQLAAGNSAAFDEIYRRHRKGVFGFLVRLCSDRSLAEDLFQATWLKFIASAKSLQPDSNLRAWLFSVARNHYRSHRRWSLLDFTRLLEFAAEPAPKPAELDAGLALVERAISALGPSDREVLLLVGAEGFEPAEAAHVLGISPSTLRKRLSRARARLSHRLAEQPK